MFHSYIIKVNNVCNLACTYCYYMVDAPKKGKFISEAIIYRLFETIASDPPTGRTITFYWHGGEPLLIAKQKFDRILQTQKTMLTGLTVHNSVQTNALALDDEWIEILSNHNIALGVSVDGTRETHYRFRIDHSGKGSYDRVVANVKSVIRAGVSPMCLIVVDPNVDAYRVFHEIVGLGIKKIDFLLPMRNWINHDEDFARRCGEYLIRAFSAWIEYGDPNIYVKKFVSLIKALTNKHPECCMMHNSCAGIITIEPDGQIALCDDLKSTNRDIYLLPLNILNCSLRQVNSMVHERFQAHQINSGRVSKGRQWDIPLNWCPATRYSKTNGFSNPSVDFIPIGMLQNAIQVALDNSVIQLSDVLPTAESQTPPAGVKQRNANFTVTSTLKPLS